jgi:hypothetical protein
MFRLRFPHVLLLCRSLAVFEAAVSLDDGDKRFDLRLGPADAPAGSVAQWANPGSSVERTNDSGSDNVHPSVWFPDADRLVRRGESRVGPLDCRVATLQQLSLG